MVKIYSTIDGFKKSKVQKCFIEYEIPFKLKVKNNLQMNIADASVIGDMGNHKVVVTYVFYVKKEDANKALWLISKEC